MEDSEETPYSTRKVDLFNKPKQAKPVAVNAYWLVKEKEKILQALREFGCTDYEKLSKAVGTKSVEQVKYFLKQRVQAAKKKSTYSSVSPIELWIEKILKNLSQKCDYSVCLAQVLSKCAQRPYGEVYEFLVLLLRNEAPRDLSVSSNNVVLQLLQDLATLVQSIDLTELHKALTEEPQHKTVNESAELLQQDDILEFYADGFAPDGKPICSFNPLNLNPSILRDVFVKVNQQIDELFLMKQNSTSDE